MTDNDTIIILGNGPSLKTAHFPLLAEKHALGMNAAYRYWEKIDWYPKIYCCLDDQVVVSHAEQIKKMIDERRCEHFFLATHILDIFPDIANSDGVLFLPQLRPGPVSQKQCETLGLTHRPSKFFGSDNPAKLTTGAYSVRFAAAMGYTKIGLIGIDCRYVEVIEEAKAEEGIALSIAQTPKHNPNYFFDDYQQAGDRYNIPNPEKHEGNLHLQAFEALKMDFEKRKFPVRLINCAVESELYETQLFPFEPTSTFLGTPRLSAVFVPFVERDVPRLLKNMARWNEDGFRPYTNSPKVPSVELHFAFNGGPSPKIERAITEQFEVSNLGQSFSALKFNYSNLKGLKDLYTREFAGERGPEGYMAGPNNQFFDIITRFSKGHSHIHLIEADVVPLKDGWLSTIDRICRSDDSFWICGSHYRGKGDVKALWHINGNAIYNVGNEKFQSFFANDYLPYFYERVKKVPSLAYDIVLYDLMKNAMAATDPDAIAIEMWKKVAHRVRFSEHIVDLSHTDDFYVENLRDPDAIRAAFPDASLAHGAVGGFATPTNSLPQPVRSHAITASDTQVLFIEPDGKDANGHYFSYAARLHAAFKPKDVMFTVIGRQDADLSALPDDMDFIPCLSTHSWSVGNRQDGMKAAAADLFRDELSAALVAADAETAKSSCLYMYYGSFEHARTIREVLKDYPSATATVNLFWTSFLEAFDVRYVNRWRPDIWAMFDDPRITLTAPTTQTADDIEQAFGVRLPVAPHPSPTFTDSQVVAFSNTPETQRGTSTKVTFPGGMRKEKGFDLTCGTALALTDRSDFDVVVRTASASADASGLQIAERLSQSGITCESGDMSDDVFRQFLGQADIIVCPYRASHFAKRTSGLVVDALVLGRPVVALKETWLGAFVEDHGIGIAVDADVEAIAQAIKTIAADYDAYAKAGFAAREGYLETDGWAVIANSILEGIRVSQNLSPQASADDEANVILELPSYIRAPIFLPTDRMPINERVAGLNKVRDLYNGGLLDESYRPKLRDLKAARHRKRCFVIGNGPSLKSTDLSRLKDEVTFATNGFFLKLPELQWAPTYYVVEDHLVAEDRAREINRLRGSTKLFPANLRYVIEPDDRTIFFDHRPRVSFPNGFDFSFDADKNTYAGGTVTFTCMQLAAYMGFEEIYLIGVDASYAIPEDAKVTGPGRVKEIDMQSDDPNHFHPDYFGKGKRWHEPNVDVMIKAYEEARAATKTRGVHIINATVGGKLEVFPRKEYASLFPAKKPRPRLLVIDMTRVGDASATGELKANLLADWPTSSVAQLYQAGAGKVAFKTAQSSTIYDKPRSDDFAAIKAAVEAFNPDVVLYRPTPKTDALHAVAMALIKESDTPLATWIMDDWPTSYAKESPKNAANIAIDFRWLLQRSNVRLSISDAMSEALGARYGVGFSPIANGVTQQDWPKTSIRKVEGAFKVRYAGSLAENMTLSSVQLVGEAVEALANHGIDIVFEIKTREIWKNLAAPKFKHLSRTSFIVADLEPNEYRAWLSGADTVAIGYNFDSESMAYTRYSLANKLPECLASGAPLLAVGPADSATLQTLTKHDCGIRICEDNWTPIADALGRLVGSDELRFDLAKRGQSVAFDAFSIVEKRNRFAREILAAANLPSGGDSTGLPRSLGARVDETAVVAHLMRDRKGPGHTMLDVGAHYGSSAEYFDVLGWSIHCFEPDPKNRKHLMKVFGESKTVRIDPRAVSDKPAAGLQFFTSDESTGISGLHPFRDTHKLTATVDATTVEEITVAQNIQSVDFLKIDVEGFDLNVLKGVPWQVLQPDAIECEFEDGKTLRLGHDWRHVGEFLRTRGYAVYVSEWHPIIRYGIAHDWKRVVPFENCEMESDSWGNFIAFRTDPGYAKVSEAFQTLATYRKVRPKLSDAPAAVLSSEDVHSSSNLKASVTNSSSGGRKPPSSNPSAKSMLQKTLGFDLRPVPSPGGMWYSKPAHKIRAVSPRLFELLRFARRSSVHLLTSPLLLVLLFAAAGLTSWFMLDARFADTRPLLLVSAALGLLTLATGYIAARAQTHAAALHLEAFDIKSELLRLKESIAGQNDPQLIEAKLTEKLASLKADQTALEQSFATKSNFNAVLGRLTAVEARTSDLHNQVKVVPVALEELSQTIAEMPSSIEEVRTNFSDGLGDMSTKLLAAQETTAKTAAGLAAMTARLTEIDAAHEALRTQTAHLLQTLQAQGEEVSTGLNRVSEEVKKFDGRISATERWSRFDNATWFQHFNRRLSKQHIETLEKEWRKRLSIPIVPAILGYMADRACEIERKLDGRLATSIEDILLRTLVARAVKGKRIDVLEIGTLFATGAAIMFDSLEGNYQEVHFTLLDPLEGYYHGSQADILTGQRVDEHAVRRNLQRVGMREDQYTLIKHLSTEPEAMNAAAERQYDVLIIDGDHSYAGVKTDFENYAHMVRVGGYIIFDDYSSSDWPEVTEYVDSELGGLDHVARVGTSWRTCVYRVVKVPAKQASDASTPKKTSDATRNLAAKSATQRSDA